MPGVMVAVALEAEQVVPVAADAVLARVPTVAPPTAAMAVASMAVPAVTVSSLRISFTFFPLLCVIEEDGPRSSVTY